MDAHASFRPNHAPGGIAVATATLVLMPPRVFAAVGRDGRGRNGDYISTSVAAGGNAYPVIPVASSPTGSTFHVPMVVPTGGMPIAGGLRAATVWTGPQPTAVATAAPTLAL